MTTTTTPVTTTPATTPVATSPDNFAELTALETLISDFIVALAAELSGGSSAVKIVAMVTTLLADPAFSSFLANYSNIAPDFKAMNATEAVTLMVLLMSGIPKYIAAFKTTPAIV